VDYCVYHFTVNPKESGNEVLIALLAEYPFESFSDTDQGFDAFITSDAESNLIVEMPDIEGIEYAYTKSYIKDENWNAKWEENFDPVIVENKLTIRAPFHATPDPVLLDVIIMPKMSFGTGHHATTYLMSEALFDLDLNQKTLLDMGCGTGVLAIIAAKRGAKSIDAIDIDDWCVENTIENCNLNHIDNISVSKGDARAISKQYDIILANINKNVLKADMKTYYDHINQNGILLISGFFSLDIADLSVVFEMLGFSVKHIRSKGDWAMIQLQK
jgi:ribosomal protein L11 methyltransferase